MFYFLSWQSRNFPYKFYATLKIMEAKTYRTLSFMTLYQYSHIRKIFTKCKFIIWVIFNQHWNPDVVSTSFLKLFLSVIIVRVPNSFQPHINQWWNPGNNSTELQPHFNLISTRCHPQINHYWSLTEILMLIGWLRYNRIPTSFKTHFNQFRCSNNV